MQLSFLGKSYEAYTPVIDTIETQHAVSFLGRCSVVKQQQVAHRSLPPTEKMTYRGVRYTR